MIVRDKILPEKHGTFRTRDFECCLWAVEKPSISRRLWFGVHRANKIDAIVLFLNGGSNTNWFIIDGNPKSLAENNQSKCENVRWFVIYLPTVGKRQPLCNADPYTDQSYYLKLDSNPQPLCSPCSDMKAGDHEMSMATRTNNLSKNNWPAHRMFSKKNPQ